jgi:hypothetical protein
MFLVNEPCVGIFIFENEEEFIQYRKSLTNDNDTDRASGIITVQDAIDEWKLEDFEVYKRIG